MTKPAAAAYQVSKTNNQLIIMNTSLFYHYQASALNLKGKGVTSAGCSESGKDLVCEGQGPSAKVKVIIFLQTIMSPC